MKLPARASPEEVVDAALTEAVSTLRLARMAQDQPAVLTAVLGLWRLYKVIPESSVKRQEPRRDTWTQRRPVTLPDGCREATPGEVSEEFVPCWVVGSHRGQGLAERWEGGVMAGVQDSGEMRDGATCWRGICTSLPSALLPDDMT